MTDTKKLLYKIEDTFKLGIQLPTVAFRSIKAIQWPTTEGDIAMGIVKKHVEEFISNNQCDFDDNDERALIRAFIRETKEIPDYLAYYRKWEKLLEFI